MKFLKPKFWDNKSFSPLVILLFPITLCYIFFFNFKKVFTKKYNFSVPVICVGNIYLGGTSKTPVCIEIFKILKKLKRKPAFIRKKYKSFEDEINLLKQTGRVYENKKRIEAINNAIKDKSDIVILDDGFQDFSIKKKLSIICFNEKQWIGNGFVIPSGPLREKITALNEAHYVFLNGKKNTSIENQILEINNSLKIFYINYELKNINEFEKKKVISFAGIGNPINFFDLLKKNNVNVLEEVSFPDHYNYSNKDLNDLIKKAKGSEALLLTTEKDYLRISDEYKQNIKYVKAKIKIDNENEFVDEMKKFI